MIYYYKLIKSIDFLLILFIISKLNYIIEKYETSKCYRIEFNAGSVTK